MAVDVNNMKFVRRKHAHKLLLVEVYFKHFDAVRALGEKCGSRHVKNRGAMKNDKLAGNPGSLSDGFFVLGNMQKTTARNDYVEGV